MSLNRVPLVLAWACFLSFGWGMVRHFRRTGGLAFRTRITASLAIPCALVNLAALSLRAIQLPVTASLLYVASFVLFWTSVRVSVGKLAACGEPNVRSCVLRDGPYRVIRHPFYSSYALAWIAGFVATAWWPLAVSALMMCGIYGRFAREEESAFLRSSLAAEYAEYRSVTGMYIPRLW